MMAKADPAPTMGSSKWLCGPGWQPAELPAIGQSDMTPLLPDCDLWDCWPLQHEDGSKVEIDGVQYWFFLSSPRLPDPGQRHHHARVSYIPTS